MSAQASPGGAADRDRRHLSLPAFAGVVLVYLAIIAALGALSRSAFDVDGEDLRSAGDVAAGLLVPIGVSLLFVYGVIAWLGWWRPVLHEPRRVQRWVWAVPAIFVACILLAIDYGALADAGVALTLVLLLTTLCVGFAEEGMFRGIGLTALRDHGLREGQVALWSSVIFGAAHLVNAVSTGTGAIGQALAVSFAGYFFYLTRRTSGGLLVPALVHGLFDFSIFSGTFDGTSYAGSAAAILAYLIVGVLLLVRRHRIEAVSRAAP